MRWDALVRKRADRTHARKKRARQQLRHLRAIKSAAQLRQMVLATRWKQ